MTASVGRTGTSRRRNSSLVLSAVVALGMVTVACTSSNNNTNNSTTLKPGGTLRVGTTALGLSANLDPVGEYSPQGFDLLTYLARGLYVYKFSGGADGNTAVPDLATGPPDVSADGLTYTIHLRPGVKFGPPVNRAITSSDVAYEFERINMPSLAPVYGFYFYGIVQGMDGNAKKIAPIPGITTPDAQTIVFKLTQPTGDFVSRLALPAAEPVPSEVAKCFTQAGTYGDDLVSSGPYMIDGSQNVDASSCGSLKPMSGYNASSFLHLVRNPAYVASTDPSTGRKNYPDQIQISVDTNESDIFAKIQNGQLDSSWIDIPPKPTLQQYSTNPQLKNQIHDPTVSSRVFFLQMNLAQPPFDDLHVRKAVAWILDKSQLQQLSGGSLVGGIADHLSPGFLFGNAPFTDPYPTPGNAGSLSKAQAEMKLSKYDPKGDGKCDESVCKNIIMPVFNYYPWTDFEVVFVQDLAKLGIQVVPREYSDNAFWNITGAVKNHIALMPAYWDYDYPDPFTYYNAMWAAHGILAEGNNNFSLVGLTPQKAKQIGVTYPKDETIPSLDSRISACEVKTGQARTDCWASFEQYTMANVVPLVPFLWPKFITITGPNVQNFTWAPFQGLLMNNMALSSGSS
jgi:peptide/nickel transport system substrate-binding protein